jgi:hypothetical protein
VRGVIHYDESTRERGACVYEAYAEATGGLSLGVLLEAGTGLTDWDELAPEIQRCWIEAAEAVCRRYGAIY